MQPVEYCQQKAAPHGSSLYYAIYFADRTRQPALYAVNAFHAELAAIVREVSDPKVAQIKLKWWEEELARAFEGKGAHPVSQALQEHALPHYNLQKEYFEQVIEGVQMDLEYGLYPSFKELSLYCHRIRGSIAHLSVEICGYSDRNTVRFAHDLGMGLQLMELLRDVRPHADAGRIYIPEDEMQRAGVSQAQLLRAQSSDAVRALFAEQAARVRDFFASALERLPEADRYAQRSNLILIRHAQALLKEMEADGLPLLERRYSLTPIRKLWIAWRTARQATRSTR